MDKYEQEIFISPNTKILNNNPENLYRKRLCSIDNVAEIYHENSKILKRNESSFKANLENMIRTNNWAYKTFNSTLNEDLKENQNIILNPFEYKDLEKRNFYQKLFEWYSLNAEKIMFTDIFIMMDKTLYQVAGDAKKLVLQMSNIDINFLKENIIRDCQLEGIQSIVFFVARPWRYMRFIGNRGYSTQKGYMRNKILDCCIEQNFMEDASLVFVLVSNLNRIKWKYGKKSYRFAHVDTGIVAQNIHLIATGNKLRSCMIAGFDDDKINKLLMIDGEMEFTSLIIAIGTSPWNILK